MNDRVARALGVLHIPFSWIGAWLAGRPQRRIVSILITVAFLVSATAILENQRAFRSVDDVALALAVGASAQNGVKEMIASGADMSHRVTVLLVGEELFETAFERRLPVDPDKLAELIRKITARGPARIAIDVDLAKPLPAGAVTNAAEERCEASAPPVHRALREALDKGIDVFGITYARHTPNGRKARNAELLELCKLESACPRDDKADSVSRGRFHLASPQVATLGAVQSVVDIPYFVGSAASLGFAAACIPPIDTEVEKRCLRFGPQQENVYCDLLAATASGDVRLVGVDDDGRPVGAGGQPDQHRAFINFLPRAENQVAVVVIDSMNALEALPPGLIAGKIVFLGLRSFGALDEFVTPAGRKAGAVVHAYVANSMLSEPLEPNHLSAALVDFAIGLLFSLTAVTTLDGLMRWHRTAPNLSGAAHIVALPVLLAAFFWIVLTLMPWFMARAEWLNPLPMLLGLTAHAYWEAIEGGMETRQGESWLEWLAAPRAGHAAAEERRWKHDAHVGVALRGFVFFVIGWGAVVVAIHARGH